jgi:hypothetical protein
MRPLCSCGQRPVAVNYKKHGKTFYRTKCDRCLRNGTPKKPRWHQSGYRQKSECEKCGFKAEYKEQLRVYHIDGNLENCRPANLKTICANCQIAMQRRGVKWKQGDLSPDF